MKTIDLKKVSYLNKDISKFHGKNWKALAPVIDLYNEIGNRNVFLFEWLLFVFENITLPGVNKKYISSLAITKTTLAIFVTLIDDVADRPNNKNKVLLEELFNLIDNPVKVNNLDVVQKKYVENTQKIWSIFLDKVKKYPRYSIFSSVLDYDIQQLVQSMRYSFLINIFPAVANTIEVEEQGGNSMIVFIQGDLDLMCFNKFDLKEFTELRKVFYYSQKMAKIGNILTTYTREVKEKDLSSDILIKAFEDDDFTVNEVFEEKFDYVINHLKNHENYFIKKWDGYYKEIEKISKSIKSVNMKEFLKQRKFIMDKFYSRVNYWESDFKHKRYFIK